MTNIQKGFVLFPVLIAVILVLGIAGIFVYKNIQVTNKPSNEQQPVISSNKSTSTNPPNTTSVETECSEFPDMLETCTKYTCKFTHPLTGEKMTREIIGIVIDKCSYKEELPNSGQMDCSYTQEMQKAVAQYHRNLISAESFGTEFSVEINEEGAESEAIYTIDGKKVNNPLEEALTNGQCVISGY